MRRVTHILFFSSYRLLFPGLFFSLSLLASSSLLHRSALFHLICVSSPLSLSSLFSASFPPYSVIFSICFFTLLLCILTLLKGSLSLTLSLCHFSPFPPLYPSFSLFVSLCLSPSLPPFLSLPPSPSHPHPSLSLHAHLIHFTHYGSIHHFALRRKNLSISLFLSVTIFSTSLFPTAFSFPTPTLSCGFNPKAGTNMFYFQLVIMAGTVLLAYYFEYTDTFPVHIQGFFCFDKAYSKPYPGPEDNSKAPPVLVYSLVTAIPTVTVSPCSTCEKKEVFPQVFITRTHTHTHISHDQTWQSPTCIHTNDMQDTHTRIVPPHLHVAFVARKRGEVCRCVSSWSHCSVCVDAFSVITMATGTIFVLHRAVTDSYSVQRVCPYFKIARY